MRASSALLLAMTLGTGAASADVPAREPEPGQNETLLVENWNVEGPSGAGLTH